MAKDKPPAFQFYPDAWLSSTDILLMSPAEEGAYIRLLSHAWMAEDCGLPNDDAQLAIISRLGKQWPKSGKRLRAKFEAIGDRLFNTRLVEERVKQEEWRRKSSEGGKLSAATKAQAKLKGGSRVVDEWLQPKVKSREEEEREVSSSVEVLAFVAPKPSYTMDEPFMMFMAEVAFTDTPLIDADYLDAHKEWAALDMPERMLAISNFQEKRLAGTFSDPAMVPRPFRWLKRKEFNRRAVKARDSPDKQLGAPKPSIYRRTEASEMGWDGVVDGPR